MRVPVIIASCFDLLRPVVRLLVLLALFESADARVTRIQIDTRAPAFDSQSFGAVGPYEVLHGRAFGEVDPTDRHNAIIQDIRLAARNSRGMVEYVTTFTLLRPVDASKGNRVLFYEVTNRGMSLHSGLNIGGDPGDAFLYKRGYTILYNGWQGDLAPAPTAGPSPTASMETIALPRARNPDGTSITGAFLVRIPTLGPTGPSGDLAKLDQGRGGPLSYEPASFDTATASLSVAPAETIEGGETGPRQQIARADWMWADCASGEAPVEPLRPANLCIRMLKGTFDPQKVYTLVFMAKDPLVLGLGLAATRDIVSFFRYSKHDDDDNLNPLSGAIPYVIAQGISQAGNFVKTFIHLGFNEDEQGRIVWDGANAHIAGRFAPINFRFAVPGGSGTLYTPGSEAILWWGRGEDAAGRRLRGSMLDRCYATHTCPKIIETMGSSELWNQRMSVGLVGTTDDYDIPLPSNVRRYYLPGTTHGGGEGGFHTGNSSADQAESPSGARASNACLLASNPNSERETLRALTSALTQWVAADEPPPASRYPTLRAGLLTLDQKGSLRFPSIPGVPSPYNLANPTLVYDFGPHLNRDDLSGYIDHQPPLIRQVIPAMVPTVDVDGNEESGVSSVLHATPLGTYLGWNVTRMGVFAGQICSFNGGFVPFANTRADRLLSGDPRLSIEERYGSREGYVCAVRNAAQRSVNEGFLLKEDALRLVDEAASATRVGDLAFLPTSSSDRSRALCAEALVSR